MTDFPLLILQTEISIYSAKETRRMNREYHAWHSPSLARTMELLVFGHSGTPMIVFPTSRGRFFDYENRGMVDAVRASRHGGKGAALLPRQRRCRELVQL